MPTQLPLRANLEWLKKTSKERLHALRAQDPAAQLADAQLATAREYGFQSWRALHEHVSQVESALGQIDVLRRANAEASAADATMAIPADDPELVRLFAAILTGKTEEVAHILTRRPALARARGTEGQTPLHVAAERDDPKLGALLLAFGADTNATFGDSGHTPLSWAVTCNAMEFAKVMVGLGVKPDLFCAAGVGSLQHVRALLDESGMPRPQSVSSGSTRYDANGKRLACPPTDPVEQLSDALYAACRNGHADVVQLLMAAQPDLSFRAYMGGTPLHWAYFGGSRAVIDTLLAAGADATALDDAIHCTPRAFGICTPASWGFVFLVKRRLDEDPSLATFMDGHTSALHQAARCGHAQAVALLLERGANPSQRDGAGKTAYELAAEAGHAAVATMLGSKMPNS